VNGHNAAAPTSGPGSHHDGIVAWWGPYYLIDLAEANVSAAGVLGRDREMAAVAAFLDAVPSGPAGLVLEGAAGIGKTTRVERGCDPGC
jgi:hypothetical protein